MIASVILLIGAFFLEGTLSNYLMFWTSFTFLTWVFSYPIFIRREWIYLILLVVVSLLFDVIYTSVLMWNTVLWFLVYFFVLRYQKRVGVKEFFVAMACFYFFGYSFLIMIGYQRDVFLFLKTIVLSLPINALYAWVIYLVLSRFYPKRRMNY